MPQYEKSLWLEIAGTVCTPWSTFGDRGCWLDSTTLACLTWAYWVRYMQPDAVLHECVKHFASKDLLDILRSRKNRTRALPRNPFGRNIDSQPRWEMTSEVLCPTMLGIPTRRPRRYTTFWLPEVVKMTHLSARDVFQKPLAMTAQAYMVASEETVSGETFALALRAGLAMQEDIPQSAYFSAAFWERIDGYVELAHKKDIDTDDMNIHNIALVNLAQNPSFSGLVDNEMAPALLTTSKLMDLVTQRMLTVFPEHFLIQGIPVDHDSIPDSLRTYAVPIGRLMQAGKVSVGQARTLSGNAMHLAVLISKIAVVLSCEVI